MGCVAGTTLNGIPYAPAPPKSGCSLVLPDALMLAINVRESERTANAVTFLFHALFAGNIGHPPRLGPEAVAPPPPPPPGAGDRRQRLARRSTPAAAATTTTTATIRPLMDTCIGRPPVCDLNRPNIAP